MKEKALEGSNPNVPTFIFGDLPFHWQMTRCEKYALVSILEAADPDVAIEIGRNKGGSLQVIAKKARKVYSIDVSSEHDRRIEEKIENANLMLGDSRDVVPSLIDRIEEKGESLDFILVDGDHSTEGVRSDLNNVIRYEPDSPCYVVFHDSFHPPCREGILSADWEKSDHVHYVEVDFIPGVYHHQEFDTAQPRSMYGGLSLALLLPEKRTESLTIHQSQRGLFESTLSNSRHSLNLRSVPRKVLGKIRDLFGGASSE
jgi:hypothetical protein